MASKLLGAILGFATGGPIGAAASLAGSSPVGKALSMYQTGKGVADQLGTTESSGAGAPGLLDRGSPDVQANAPGLLGRGDAVSRRMSALPEDPSATLNAGIEAMDHPDMIGKVHPSIAAALLGAKHFGGPHPAMDKYFGETE